MSQHGNLLTAQDLLEPDFLQIDRGQTVREALELLDGQKESLSILVVDQKKPLGCLSVELLLRYLFADQLEALDSGQWPDQTAQRLDSRIDQLPLESIVSVNPNDSLPIMLLRARQGSSEWLLVASKNKSIGIVSLRRLFQAAAAITLEGEV